MALELELRNDCKKNQIGMLARECKAAAAWLSWGLKDIPSFEKSAVCIGRETLKETFRRGYLAFRATKHNSTYNCFMFEAATPVELKKAGKSVWIDSLGKVDAKAAIKGMDAVITGRKEVETCSEHTENGVTYKVYKSETLAGQSEAKLTENLYQSIHTHPYCPGEDHIEVLSYGDLYTLAKYGTFMASLGIDGTKFMEKVRDRGTEAFDKKGSLKFEHIITIAAELAGECATPKSLKKQYKDVGMPLVAASMAGKTACIYTKLRIT